MIKMEKLTKKEYNIVETKLVPIREVFSNEEKEFTPWLENHLHLLKMGLQPYEREKSVFGRLEMDLLVKSVSGDLVVIENQYDKSDNDHMSKILIWHTGVDATTGIWIAEEFREQHKAVILDINKGGTYNIYLIKVSAKKIVEDLETPRYIIDFNVIIAPDIELRDLGKFKPPNAKEALYKRFWGELLRKIKPRTTLFSGCSGSIGDSIGTLSSISGARYNYILRQSYVVIELGIYTGDYDRNKKIFDNIFENKEIIESNFGEELIWKRKETARYSGIAYYIKDVDWTNESKWEELHEEMIDKMLRFESVIKNYLKI